MNTPEDDLIGIMNIISEYYTGKDIKAQMINQLTKEQRQLLDEQLMIPEEFKHLNEQILQLIPQTVPNYEVLIEEVYQIATQNGLDLNQQFEWEVEIEKKSKDLIKNFYKGFNQKQLNRQNNKLGNIDNDCQEQEKVSPRENQKKNNDNNNSKSVLQSLLSALPSIDKLHSELSSMKLLDIQPKINQEYQSLYCNQQQIPIIQQSSQSNLFNNSSSQNLSPRNNIGFAQNSGIKQTSSHSNLFNNSSSQNLSPRNNIRMEQNSGIKQTASYSKLQNNPSNQNISPRNNVGMIQNSGIKQTSSYSNLQNNSSSQNLSPRNNIGFAQNSGIKQTSSHSNLFNISSSQNLSPRNNIRMEQNSGIKQTASYSKLQNNPSNQNISPRNNVGMIQNSGIKQTSSYSNLQNNSSNQNISPHNNIGFAQNSGININFIPTNQEYILINQQPIFGNPQMVSQPYFSNILFPFNKDNNNDNNTMQQTQCPNINNNQVQQTSINQISPIVYHQTYKPPSPINPIFQSNLFANANVNEQNLEIIQEIQENPNQINNKKHNQSFFPRIKQESDEIIKEEDEEKGCFLSDESQKYLNFPKIEFSNESYSLPVTPIYPIGQQKNDFTQITGESLIDKDVELDNNENNNKSEGNENYRKLVNEVNKLIYMDIQNNDQINTNNEIDINLEQQGNDDDLYQQNGKEKDEISEILPNIDIFLSQTLPQALQQQNANTNNTDSSYMTEIKSNSLAQSQSTTYLFESSPHLEQQANSSQQFNQNKSKSIIENQSTTFSQFQIYLNEIKENELKLKKQKNRKEQQKNNLVIKDILSKGNTTELLNINNNINISTSSINQSLESSEQHKSKQQLLNPQYFSVLDTPDSNLSLSTPSSVQSLSSQYSDESDQKKDLLLNLPIFSKLNDPNSNKSQQHRSSINSNSNQSQYSSSQSSSIQNQNQSISMSDNLTLTPLQSLLLQLIPIPQLQQIIPPIDTISQLTSNQDPIQQASNQDTIQQSQQSLLPQQVSIKQSIDSIDQQTDPNLNIINVDQSFTYHNDNYQNSQTLQSQIANQINDNYQTKLIKCSTPNFDFSTSSQLLPFGSTNNQSKMLNSQFMNFQQQQQIQLQQSKSQFSPGLILNRVIINNPMRLENISDQ